MPFTAQQVGEVEGIGAIAATAKMKGVSEEDVHGRVDGLFGLFSLFGLFG